MGSAFSGRRDGIDAAETRQDFPDRRVAAGSNATYVNVSFSKPFQSHQ